MRAESPPFALKPRLLAQAAVQLLRQLTQCDLVAQRQRNPLSFATDSDVPLNISCSFDLLDAEVRQGILT